MFKKPNCPVIAIEEHYWDAELAKTYTGVESGRPGPQQERLFDLGALRLKEMDETGIDMQVISHGAPSAQKLSGDGAVALVQRVNDRLAAACAANPKRFLGFAALPTCDPKAAADVELGEHLLDVLLQIPLLLLGNVEHVHGVPPVGLIMPPWPALLQSTRP